jgi:hypothetical protein
VDIPLNYTLNTYRNFGGSISGPVVILTINVGVNGGAAQAYAFDTGSAVFLTPCMVRPCVARELCRFGGERSCINVSDL